MGYVYKHIRLDKNEPFYIGVSKNNAYFKRGYSNCGRNKIWKSIKKKTDYKVEIVFENDDINLINEKEVELIKLYGRIDLGTGTLANMTDGGEKNCGFVATAEFREKMKNVRTGKKHSSETIEKIRTSILDIRKQKQLKKENKELKMKEYHLGLDITKGLKEKMVIEATKSGLTLASYVRLLLIQKHQ